MGNPDRVAAAERWLGQPFYDDPQQNKALAEHGFTTLATPEFLDGERVWLGHAALTASFAHNLIPSPDYGKRLSIVKNAEAALDEVRENGHPSLYDRQISAYEAGLKFVLNRNPSDTGLAKAGRFEITTGYGKTVLMANLGAALLGKNPLKNDLKLLVVVPSHFLSDQTKGMHPEEEYREGFALHAPHLSVTELSGRAFDSSGDVIITTYNFFCRHAGGQLNLQDYPLIFFDEAHHMVGDVTSRAVERECKKSAIIGFTATPETNKGHIQTLLPELLQKKTIVDGVLREGFLGGIQMFGVMSQNTIHDKPKSKAHEYTQQEVGHLIADDDRNKLIIETALLALEKSQGERGIIRCIPGNNQVHARMLAQALDGMPHPTKERPIKAEAIGAHRKDNTDIMRRFKNGEFDILTGINIFGEGLDIPDLTWAVYAAPTRSRPQLEQFIGRLMRPKDWPALFFQVIDRVDFRDDRIFGYDIFDEQPRQGLALLPPQRASQLRQKLIAHKDLPKHMQSITDAVWDRLRTGNRGQANMAEAVKDMAKAYPSYANLGEDNVSLRDLEMHYTMPGSLMARILFANSYGATQALDSAGNLQHYYSAQAKTYLDYLIAAPQDRTIEQVSADLDVDRQKLIYHLGKNNIQPRPTYGRTNKNGAHFVRHLTPQQVDVIREILQLPKWRLSPEGLLDSEITLSEAGVLGQSTTFAKGEYYRVRGFDLTEKVITPGDRMRTILDRQAVTAHIQSYLNAPPRPESGYTIVSRHSENSDRVRILAHQNDIPILFFIHNGVIREYAADADFRRLHQLLQGNELTQPQQEPASPVEAEPEAQATPETTVETETTAKLEAQAEAEAVTAAETEVEAEADVATKLEEPEAASITEVEAETTTETEEPEEPEQPKEIPKNLLLGVTKRISQLPASSHALPSMPTADVPVRRFRVNRPDEDIATTTNVTSLQLPPSPGNSTPQASPASPKQPVQTPHASNSEATPDATQITEIQQAAPADAQLTPSSQSESSRKTPAGAPTHSHSNTNATRFISLADVDETINAFPNNQTLASVMNKLNINPIVNGQEAGVTFEQAQNIRSYIREQLKEEELALTKAAKAARVRAEQETPSQSHLPPRAPAQVIARKQQSHTVRPQAVPAPITPEQQLALYTNHYLRRLLPTLYTRTLDDTDHGFTSLHKFAERQGQPIVTVVKLIQASMSGDVRGSIVKTDRNILLINRKVQLHITSPLMHSRAIPPNWVSSYELNVRGISHMKLMRLAPSYPDDIHGMTIDSTDEVSNSENPSGLTPEDGVYYFVSPSLAKRIIKREL